MSATKAVNYSVKFYRFTNTDGVVTFVDMSTIVAVNKKPANIGKSRRVDGGIDYVAELLTNVGVIYTITNPREVSEFADKMGLVWG